MKTSLLSGLLAILLIACSNSRNAASSNQYDLDGDWQLTTIERQSAESISRGKAPFIKIDSKSSRISGSTGCNSFSAPLKLDGTVVDLKQAFMMTKMYCEGVDESRFMNTLERGTKFNFINENTLQLKSGDSLLMEFSRLLK